MNRDDEDNVNFMIENNNANVAGRDINIIQQESKTLWDLTTRELQDELARCVYKRSEIYKKFILPLMLMLLGFGTLVISLNFKGIAMEYFLLVMVFGIGFPVLWCGHLEKRKKSALAFYRERIDYIKLILLDRI